ncbi:unnamed protein product [Adineta steineri]|uniref:TIR domain-containing protein n=1 Tax=Adineta steineri TaxID=433720 RepID=A0A819BJA4_9BILA|nr:unnamed protein product [Adineta steineri]CAF3802108.1 unnamed protein product [Adineta steineri]
MSSAAVNVTNDCSPILIPSSTPPNATINTGSELPPISETTSPPANQDEVGRPGAISTNLPWNSNRYISEWNSDEVLRWFQSRGLNKSYECLCAPDEVITGKTLEEMFKMKQKNYGSYRANYPNNLSKDFHQFEQLLDSYFVAKRIHRFDVAVSFAGERRDRVRQIADKLCVKIKRPDAKERIFYDYNHQAELARPELDLELERIYRYQTRLIVVFMCNAYSRKKWCRLEERAIRGLWVAGQKDRIMLLSVDGTITEPFSDLGGYMDISEKSDDDVVDAIYSRLKALDDPLSSSQSSHTSTQQPILEGVLSNRIEILRNVLRSISPWYIIIVLLSYILGTIIGR